MGVVKRRARATARRRALRASSRWSLAAVGLSVFLAAQMMFAMTAGNTVPASMAGESSVAITANTLKPPECSGITVTTILIGSTLVNGSNESELILGSSGLDTISGSGGDDCILGGAGTDVITGGSGTDVCIGGPGTDTFPSGCETQIQ